MKKTKIINGSTSTHVVVQKKRADTAIKEQPKNTTNGQDGEWIGKSWLRFFPDRVKKVGLGVTAGISGFMMTDVLAPNFKIPLMGTNDAVAGQLTAKNGWTSDSLAYKTNDGSSFDLLAMAKQYKKELVALFGEKVTPEAAQQRAGEILGKVEGMLPELKKDVQDYLVSGAKKSDKKVVNAFMEDLEAIMSALRIISPNHHIQSPELQPAMSRQELNDAQSALASVFQSGAGERASIIDFMFNTRQLPSRFNGMSKLSNAAHADYESVKHIMPMTWIGNGDFKQWDLEVQAYLKGLQADVNTFAALNNQRNETLERYAGQILAKEDTEFRKNLDTQNQLAPIAAQLAKTLKVVKEASNLATSLVTAVHSLDNHRSAPDREIYVEESRWTDSQGRVHIKEAHYETNPDYTSWEWEQRRREGDVHRLANEVQTARTSVEKALGQLNSTMWKQHYTPPSIQDLHVNAPNVEGPGYFFDWGNWPVWDSNTWTLTSTRAVQSQQIVTGLAVVQGSIQAGQREVTGPLDAATKHVTRKLEALVKELNAVATQRIASSPQS